MINWIARLWYRHYLRKYTSGKRTSYGALYSMADILYEAECNPFCPHRVIRQLRIYHLQQTNKADIEMMQAIESLRHLPAR